MRQITLRELLEDPVYRKWFQKPPTVREPQRWRVYAQEEEGGPWRAANFDRWEWAYHYVRRHYKMWYDCALCSRVWEWRPPVVRYRGERVIKGRLRKVWKRKYYEPMVNMMGHTWCPHCRRPTVFRKFRRHHTVGKALPYKERCSICGITISGVRQYRVAEEEDGASA